MTPEQVIDFIRSQPGAGRGPQRTANVFIDPTDYTFYPWPINHSTEEAMGRSRQMGDGAPTANNGELLPQSGASKPLVLSWKGRILTASQRDAMTQWWSICDQRTIFILTFRDELYEVLITDLTTTVVGVARNRADMVNARLNVWDYTLTMRVLAALTPPWGG